jgi:L-alanine-DL-glutamate epimerase-like enolase superfamily enzyme
MTGLSVTQESWSVCGSFTISRGTRTHAEVVVCALSREGGIGRGECLPYPRYGESVEGVVAEIEGLREELARGLDREALQARLPAGAARNGLDCAFWDLEAKSAGKRVWDLAGILAPEPTVTAFTLSLDTPEKMAAAAADNADRPLLKLKLAGAEDLERVRAVRASAPDSRLVIDANEGWSVEDYRTLAPQLAELGVALIEQPLPAGEDEGLRGLDRPVPLCADESCHDRRSLPGLLGLYDVINIKLDKTGGLTEALALKAAAQEAGLGIMVGCMLTTSLAMAPAMLLTAGAVVVDLDGPLLLSGDRENGLVYEGSVVHPPSAALWG